MGIFKKIKGWFSVLLRSKAKDEFNIEAIGSEQMMAWVNECINIYRGNPSWIDEDDHVDTVNFAKAICTETARLVTLGIGIHVSGSPRAVWLQEQVNRIYYQLRDWVEYGCAYGTIILKPDGDTVRLYTPAEFEVTHHTDGKVDGAIFHNWKKVGEKWYTLLEYHRFEGKQYAITNKCYVGNRPDDTTKPVEIKDSPWDMLADEVYIDNVDKPLFGVFRTPSANNIDMDSPCGLPLFSEAVQELRDLDISYSRNAKEIFDSKRTVLIDADRILPDAERIRNADALGHSVMPDYIKLVADDTSVESDIYHEINPQLNTEMRLKGMNALLNQIGYKSGYSNGHFVFNESGGIQTATQVEADQQRTIQTIKDVRDKLENCLGGLIYSLSVFADLYGYTKAGSYEVVYDFSDITYSFEEDRAHHYQLASQGRFPWEEYYVRFLKYSREDARRLLKMAKSEQAAPTLFGGEE